MTNIFHCAFNNTNVSFKSAKVSNFLPLPGCLLEASFRAEGLSNQEKLFYIYAYSLALINSNSGSDFSVTLSAHKWAKYLGCSRSSIFIMQKKLAEFGFFVIRSSVNKIGQNDRNIIIPTIPDLIFDSLKESPNRRGCFDVFDPYSSSKAGYLNRTKLFVPLSYNFLKEISSHKDLNPISKIIWLDLFVLLHKNSFVNNGSHLVISFKELGDKYNISSKTIAKYIALLANAGLLSRSKVIYKNNNLASNSFRSDKICWQISLIDPVLNVPIVMENKVFAPILDHQGAKSGLLIKKEDKEENNKDRSTKHSFESNFKSNFVSFKDSKSDNFASSLPQETNSRKEKTLNDFYPLTKEEGDLLQKNSGREFSLNAMNEILKDMASKLTNRVFKSRKAFLSYMGKALSYEMRDAVKTSGESFRIRNNQTEEEKTNDQIEEYLKEIEYSLQVSPEWHFKKKLCAVLEPRTAYEFLRNYQTSQVEARQIEDGYEKEGQVEAGQAEERGNIFKIYLNKEVNLKSFEKEIILNQARASHNSVDLKSGEIVAIKEIEIVLAQPVKKQNPIATAKIASEIELQHPITEETNDHRQTANKPTFQTVPQTEAQILWNKVRQKLKQEYGEQGEGIDKNWLSKLTPEISIKENGMQTITLKAPNNFFKDWIERNYKESIMAYCLLQNVRFMEVLA